jgi:nitronate monooxygenase
MLGADGVLVGTRFYATQEAVGASRQGAHRRGERRQDHPQHPVRHRAAQRVARALHRPCAAQRVLRALARPRGRADAAQAEEAARYDKARQEGDFDTAAVIAGEGVRHDL